MNHALFYSSFLNKYTFPKSWKNSFILSKYFKNKYNYSLFAIKRTLIRRCSAIKILLLLLYNFSSIYHFRLMNNIPMLLQQSQEITLIYLDSGVFKYCYINASMLLRSMLHFHWQFPKQPLISWFKCVSNKNMLA